LHGVPGSIKELAAAVASDRTASLRCDQARGAVLPPLFAGPPQPLVPLDAGTSAGFCLLPDRYGYD